MNDREIIEQHRKNETAKKLADAKVRLLELRKLAPAARREADEARADAVRERQGLDEALADRAQVRRLAHARPFETVAREAAKVEERVKLAAIRVEIAEERHAQFAGKAEALETEAVALGQIVRGFDAVTEGAARSMLRSHRIDRLVRARVLTDGDVQTLRSLAAGEVVPEGAKALLAIAEKLSAVPEYE